MQEMQEMWFQYLGQEDLLEWEIATHSSIPPALHQGTDPQFQNTNWLEVGSYNRRCKQKKAK